MSSHYDALEHSDSGGQAHDWEVPMSWFWKPCDEELTQKRWIESLRRLSQQVRVARDKKGLTRASPFARQHVAIECFVENKIRTVYY